MILKSRRNKTKTFYYYLHWLNSLFSPIGLFSNYFYFTKFFFLSSIVLFFFTMLQSPLQTNTPLKIFGDFIFFLKYTKNYDQCWWRLTKSPLSLRLHSFCSSLLPQSSLADTFICQPCSYFKFLKYAVFLACTALSWVFHMIYTLAYSLNTLINLHYCLIELDTTIFICECIYCTFNFHEGKKEILSIFSVSSKTDKIIKWTK